MKSRRTKIIATLGPATSTEQDILTIRDKGVDFVRINMSHSSIPDLKRYIGLAQDAGIPFILDTEGSQVRTGDLETEVICFQENDEILVRSRPIVGNRQEISLKPGSILEQLQPGDLIHIDFDTLILRVMDVSNVSHGVITTRAITGGFIGKTVDGCRTHRVLVHPLWQRGRRGQAPDTKQNDDYLEDRVPGRAAGYRSDHREVGRSTH